jgi:hypothetical protein
MTVTIHKNFLNKEECQALNKIAEEGVRQGWIDKGVQGMDDKYALRYTSRMYMSNAEYPQIVRDISERIRLFMGLEKYPLIIGHGKDGVVVTITYQNGSVYKHFDPKGGGNLPTYRCNVLTQANEKGCDLYVEGNKIEIEVGDLHCYAVSELEHFVTKAEGKTPRIMWMFGAHVPLKDLKERGLF